MKNVERKSGRDKDTKKRIASGTCQRIPREFTEPLYKSFFKWLLSFLYKKLQDPVYGLDLLKNIFYFVIDNE